MLKKYLKPILGLLSIFAILLFAWWAISRGNPETHKPSNTGNTKSDEISEEITISYDDILLEINKSRKTEYYNIVQIPDTEYVKDNIGAYFMIDLKNSNNLIIKFEDGEYTFAKSDKEFARSLNKVKSNILDSLILNKGFKYKIFIEGQADLKGDKKWSRMFDTCCEYGEISYLPKLTKGAKNIAFYDKIESTAHILEPIKNENLPLLRAKFISTKMENYTSIHKPIILEGEVIPILGEEYRNASIVLFIEKYVKIDKK